MSMIGCYMRIRPQTLNTLLEDPQSALDGLLEADEEAGGAGQFDIDKAWHGIHYLLNGEAWGGSGPLFGAVLGGTELEGTEIGYGPARYLTPQQVAATAAALAAVTAEDLRSKYDPGAMDAAQVYPTIWTRDGEEALDYLLEHFVGLQAYFQEASAAGDAMVLYIG